MPQPQAPAGFPANARVAARMTANSHQTLRNRITAMSFISASVSGSTGDHYQETATLAVLAREDTFLFISD
jgi:hypothetical protein